MAGSTERRVLKVSGGDADRWAVNRRLADKHLAGVRRRRTDRYLEHDLVGLFGLLVELQERVVSSRQPDGGGGAVLERHLAELDEVRDEIEARGICPYHQAALSVCCFP